MNIERLQQALLAAARSLPQDDRVPYAFEKRVMAALTREAPVDPWAVWSRSLWRAAAPCVGIMLLVSVWSAVASSSGNSGVSLAADLDRTVWGPLSPMNDSW